MISEGTDIPRLQVCCYLSRIRTELHYRQVLGRVLRRTGESDDQAWLFMLAEPTLHRLAERIAEDLPEDLAVLNEIQIPVATSDSKESGVGLTGNIEGLDISICLAVEEAILADTLSTVSLGGYVAELSYQVSFSQHYRQQLLACF
jgi:hypothetical protein